MPRTSGPVSFADYPIRPTVMKMTGRRRMSPGRRGLLSALSALAGVLGWAALVRHVFGLG